MQATLRNPYDTAGLSGPSTQSLVSRVVFAVAATGLMALAAHVSLPLPFSPVPLALTPFAVLLIGMMLGPVTAFAAMVLYLLEGAAGLPVFTPQGPGGIMQLLGPTGGFLFAYPLAAASAGWMVRHLRMISMPFVRGLAAGTVAIAIIFACGASWLAALLHPSLNAVWHMAVAPFLPGEMVKIVAAATLYSTTCRWQRT